MTRLHPFGSRDDDLFGPRIVQSCGHAPHPARTCAQFEADELGINIAPEDLKRATLCRLNYDADAEAGAQARGDQTSSALEEVLAFNGFDTSTWSPDFDLHTGRSSSVKVMMEAVMGAYRDLTAPGVDSPERIVYSESDYEPHNPTDMWSVALGLLAGDPVHVEVLYDGPRPWLQKLSGRRMTCAWSSLLYGRFGDRCLEHTRHVISFSRGQFLIAVPTCRECRTALVERTAAGIQ